MCIVIDTNVFSAVFDPNCANHAEFKPVYDWVDGGPGQIVYGGTKYTQELERADKYRRLFILLKDRRKVCEIDKTKVDAECERIKLKTVDTDCDDQHIIAIVAVSGCKLICSLDKKAYDHFKNPALYPKGISIPRIYSKSKNQKLLSKQHIVPLKNIA